MRVNRGFKRAGESGLARLAAAICDSPSDAVSAEFPRQLQLKSKAARHTNFYSELEVQRMPIATVGW